jgi:hypothetical protein
LGLATSWVDDVTVSSVVNQFAFDPADNQHLFAATTMGVFETKNAGDSWTKQMDGMKGSADGGDARSGHEASDSMQAQVAVHINQSIKPGIGKK